MPPTQSQPLALGAPAPSFSLLNTVDGQLVTLDTFATQPALLVAFICNHCPYVKHVLDGFVAFARDYQPRGVAVVAISSNDVAQYPADSPEEMARLARSRGFTFPYLYDESQAVARAYDAVCTPDFFLFDRQRRGVYHGQFDSTRPNGKEPVSGADMRAAADALLAGKPVAAKQIPSVGCSIKWKRA
jgi:peroxiredoxin